MRKKKNADIRITACAEYIYRSGIDSAVNGFELEIGCGKGDFICAMAQKFPGTEYIAVEKSTDVCVIALEKAKSLNLSNLKFIIADAESLGEYFLPGAVSAVYLNFSDPWPKRRYSHKRLTAPAFLGIYKKILKPGAKLYLKTDNKDLFDYSLKFLSSDGFSIIHKTYDLYNSEFLQGNIQTEYEKKFVSQSIPICYFSACYDS